MADEKVVASYTIWLIEPFYGGSHKQLMDWLVHHFKNCSLYTLPAKKWHWRARTSALWFAQNLPPVPPSCEVLFASSVLNLAELVALRPELHQLKKVLYFHENQLTYPVQHKKDRDFQYGYNQILSCLVADEVVFNSEYNKESFLKKVDKYFNLMPDHRPKNLENEIQSKCKVIYFPVKTPHTDEFCPKQQPKDLEKFEIDVPEKQLKLEVNNDLQCLDSDQRSSNDVNQDKNIVSCQKTLKDGDVCLQTDTCEYSSHCADFMESRTVLPAEILPKDNTSPLHIIWTHRWEHDKNPEVFFNTLITLMEEGHKFRLSVLGETFTDVPAIFDEAKEKLAGVIDQWGYLPSKEGYWEVVRKADLAVSTALHEFFGVSMIEAAMAGCHVLCPNRLVYPEVFPRECLFNTDNQLLKKLRYYCRQPQQLRKPHQYDLERFSPAVLMPQYQSILQSNKLCKK